MNAPTPSDATQPPTGPRPDPSAIMALATGYWHSGALLAAVQLDLFGALADGPQTLTTVCARRGLPGRSAALLLDACAGLNLLVKTGEDEAALYANTPETAAFLVAGKPGYLGSAIGWAGDQWEAWGRLASSVQAGGPAVPPFDHLGGDPEQTRRFVLAMHQRASGVARGVVPFLDCDGVRELLDVGGGPGTYAVLLAQKYRDLRVTVLDLPDVVAIADELIAQAGLGDRVQTQAGDALTIEGDWGTGVWDGVLFSGVLHQRSASTIQTLLARARAALRPGGRVLISDVMTGPDKTEPVFATLFGCQMLLTSAEGGVFSASECADWLTQAGFQRIHVQPLPPPLPYVVVIAHLP